MEERTDLVCELGRFIADAALHADDAERLLGAIGEKMRATGLPISRLVASWRALHPLIYAHRITWTAASIVRDDYSHASLAATTDRNHPLRYVLENELSVWRVDLTTDEHEYPAFAEYAAEGHTEYVAGLERFGEDHGQHGEALRGMFLSACADAPEGFGDSFDVYMALRPLLALAFRPLIERRITEAVARTYLGTLPAERVLAGSIRRGDAQVIPAAIWYSDLRSFTPMSEALPLDETIAFLNEVFEATAGAVEEAGGNVLDFIGDAVLAIFPLADDGIARALAALDEALARLALMKAVHADDRRPVIEATMRQGIVGIALAVGDVRFGNIGTAGRLTFSVIGPTVNMVARIEGFTKLLGEPVLVERAFCEASGRRWRSRGVVELPGVHDPQELFGLAEEAAVAPPPLTVLRGDADAAPAGRAAPETVVAIPEAGERPRRPRARWHG